MDLSTTCNSRNPGQEMIIMLENPVLYFSDHEFKSLQKNLSENNIYLMPMEKRYGPMAYFGDIGVYISEHITELILTGLIMPFIYDILKEALKTIVYRIKEKVKTMQSGRIHKSVPYIEFKTRNGEIRVIIPPDLPQENFEKFMDEVRNAIKSIKLNPEIKYENYIIERHENTLKVKVKTIFQDGQEKANKDRKE